MMHYDLNIKMHVFLRSRGVANKPNRDGDFESDLVSWADAMNASNVDEGICLPFLLAIFSKHLAASWARPRLTSHCALSGT